MTTRLDVRAEQIRTVYRLTAPILLANSLNSALVCTTLWNAERRRFLIGWLCSMLVCAGLRAALALRYARAHPALERSALWGTRFAIGSACSGALWGLAAFYLIPGSSAFDQLLVSFVVGGMCAAAAGALAAYLPAFVAFVSPALAALGLRMALFGDSTHVAMAAFVAVYALGLSAVARVNHRALTRAFELRFQNAELLERLTRTQARLEETNRILEQRVAERSEALRQQAEALRDAQRLEQIGRLAGGVAHDFNNLLMVISSNVSALMERGGSSDRDFSALAEVRDAARRGADLVRQLLTVSRGRQLAQAVDLNHVLNDMHQLLARLMGEQHTLQIVASGEPLFVPVGSAQLEQVISNLVTNARDAMSSPGVVSVETELIELTESAHGPAPGTYAVLSVTDTGSGMDSATRRRIFEPFFTTKEAGKGTGLGLATVQGIVQQSGGHIAVSSQPGQGSCFRVYLPLTESAGSQRASAHAESDRAVPAPLRAPPPSPFIPGR